MKNFYTSSSASFSSGSYLGWCHCFVLLIRRKFSNLDPLAFGQERERRKGPPMAGLSCVSGKCLFGRGPFFAPSNGSSSFFSCVLVNMLKVRSPLRFGHTACRFAAKTSVFGQFEAGNRVLKANLPRRAADLTQMSVYCFFWANAPVCQPFSVPGASVRRRTAKPRCLPPSRQGRSCGWGRTAGGIHR